MARVAHEMAIESSRVRADVVEVQEFSHLAQAYRVRGVPKTVINDRVQFTGAVTEEAFLQKVLQAAGEEEIEDDPQEQISEQTTPIS